MSEEWLEADRERLLTGLSKLGWSLFRRFSARYVPSDVLAAICGLSRTDFERLRAVYDLTSDDTAEFVTRSAPIFLRSMPMAAQLRVRTDRGFPRGQLDWIKTALLQNARGADRSLFVSRSPERSRDTPAARMFGYLLDDIGKRASRTLLDHIPLSAQASINGLKSQAYAHARALAIRGVQTPTSAKSSDFSHLRRSGRPEIIQALDLLIRRGSLWGADGEEHLRKIMLGGMFAPENIDDLYEAWVLLQLVERHLDNGWQLAEARLVGGGQRSLPQFKMCRGEDVVDIFYQSVPQSLAGSSIYKDLFSDYGLDVSLRRPDIVIDVRTSTYQGPLIVEVKRSRNRRYIVDAVYKVLGYLQDFKENFTELRPKALLVVLDGIDPPDVFSPSADIWIVDEKRVRSLILPY